MRRIVHSISAIIAGMSLWGCETVSSEEQGIHLNEVASSKEILTVPYEVYGAGVLVIQVDVGNDQKARFLLDTGATRSALFRGKSGRLKLKEADRVDVTVHGMTAIGQKPTALVPQIVIDERVFENVEVVLLDERKHATVVEAEPDGLIGMDLLEGYRILVDADAKLLSLIPNHGPAVAVPGSWRNIQLIPNPYTDTDHGLHFFEMRVGNRLVPALFDTGSEFNLINWNSLHFPQLRLIKKRLREKWVVAGAIGEFDPISKVTVEGFRVGQKWWDERLFVVMDFENLGILGVDENPFVIAGGNLFAGNSFYVDFQKDVLMVRPEAFDNDFNQRRYDGIVVKAE